MIRRQQAINEKTQTEINMRMSKVHKGSVVESNPYELNPYAMDENKEVSESDSYDSDEDLAGLQKRIKQFEAEQDAETNRLIEIEQEKVRRAQEKADLKIKLEEDIKATVSKIEFLRRENDNKSDQVKKQSTEKIDSDITDLK